MQNNNERFLDSARNDNASVTVAVVRATSPYEILDLGLPIDQSDFHDGAMR